MIQDILPNHYILDYLPQAPKPGDHMVIFEKNQVLLTKDLRYPLLEELSLSLNELDVIYLFSIDTERFFLASPHRPLTDGQLLACPLRQLRELRPMAWAFAGYTAWHLFAWYRSNRFCGCCGASMIPGTDERKMVCPDCHNEVYPRINPCIIVAVHDGDRLLMTKYAGRPVNWFVLIAGFIEIGETAEDTVRREVMEEAGVKVKNIRYFGSQPWGIPGNLTLGFTAELDGFDEITLDTDELADGQWFPRDQVPVPDDDVSITSELIHAFAAGKF